MDDLSQALREYGITVKKVRSLRLVLPLNLADPPCQTSPSILWIEGHNPQLPCPPRQHQPCKGQTKRKNEPNERKVKSWLIEQ